MSPRWFAPLLMLAVGFVMVTVAGFVLAFQVRSERAKVRRLEMQLCLADGSSAVQATVANGPCVCEVLAMTPTTVYGLTFDENDRAYERQADEGQR